MKTLTNRTGIQKCNCGSLKTKQVYLLLSTSEIEPGFYLFFLIGKIE